MLDDIEVAELRVQGEVLPLPEDGEVGRGIEPTLARRRQGRSEIGEQTRESVLILGEGAETMFKSLVARM